MIYLVIIIAFLVLTYVYDYKKLERGRLAWWVIMLVLLILVAGFRYKMGGDSIRYENEYDELPTLSSINSRDLNKTRYAPLYVVLCAICRSISKEFVVLQLIVAAFVNIVFFFFIYRNTKKIFITGLLYFFFLYFVLNMEVMREAIAVGMFLLGWKSFEKNQWIKYYIFVTLAFLFHLSAIILFVVPLIKLPVVRYLFIFGKKCFIVIPIIVLLSFGIKYFLFDFVKALAISERLSERAQLYSEDKLGDSVFNLMGMISWLFKTTFYPLIALYCLKKDGRLEQESFRQVGMICMLSIYISILCLGVMILERYLHYFMIFQFLLLSYLIFSPSFYLLGRRWHYRFFGWMIAILPLFTMGFYMDYYTRVNKTGTLKIYDKYYPYTSQFDKEITPKRKKMINYQRRIR